MIYERDNQPESFRGYVLTVEQMAARDKVVSRRAIERERDRAEAERERECARIMSFFPAELSAKVEALPLGVGVKIHAYLWALARENGVRNGRIVWSGKRLELAFLSSFLYRCLPARWGDFERWFVYPIGDRRGELVQGDALRRDASKLRKFTGRDLWDLAHVDPELVKLVGSWSKSVG
jgi:hypothetical protein